MKRGLCIIFILGLALAAMFALSSGGVYERISADGTNNVDYYHIGILLADTNGAGNWYSVDTLYSDTVNLDDVLSGFEAVSVYYKLGALDTGGTDDDDTTSDTITVELFTSMGNGILTQLLYTDTISVAATIDSASWKNIPDDSLYEEMWFRFIRWDSVLAPSANDTTTFWFSSGVYAR